MELYGGECHPDRREGPAFDFPLEASQPLMSPANFRGLFSNPGNTAFKSETPLCLLNISPSTNRKSVVSAKSRPSFNWWSASPGHGPYTRPPFTSPPITNMQFACPWSVPQLP